MNTIDQAIANGWFVEWKTSLASDSGAREDCFLYDSDCELLGVRRGLDMVYKQTRAEVFTELAQEALANQQTPSAREHIILMRLRREKLNRYLNRR